MRQRSRQGSRKKIIGRTLLAVVCLLVGIGIYSLFSSVIQSVDAKEHHETPASFPTYEVVNMNKHFPTQYGGVKRKIVYLTFDDGPSPYQGEFLDVLKENNVKATFFMIGQNMTPEREENMKRLVEEGHYPGLHSMSHNYKRLYQSGGAANFIAENKEAAAIVKRVTGFDPHLIRAPYGSAPQIGESFRGDITKAGFKLWDWTLDSLDWKYPNQPDAVYNNVVPKIHQDVEVILFHEKKQTLDALPGIIKDIRAKGYEFEVYNEKEHFPLNFHHDKRL